MKHIYITALLLLHSDLYSNNTNGFIIKELGNKIISDSFFSIFIILSLTFLILSVVFSYMYKAINTVTKSEDVIPSIGEKLRYNELKETYGAAKNSFVYILCIGVILYLFYVLTSGTPAQAHLKEWLHLIVRWIHLIAGIMWIGASFYFIFLENHLNRTDGIRDELAGNLWAIHGGGFYFLEKYKVAPAQIPKNLHWFKYEAYFTWISGFALLFIVFYMDAKSFLIDPSVSDISTSTGIFIGIITLIGGWIVYDFMCKNILPKSNIAFVIIGLLLLIGITYFLTHTFNSRAAFIHVGALMGTIMAWNVYFIIIPSQKALVKAALTDQPLDATLGTKAQQRSLHNNYFTLPVLFIMISNHFPGTFAHKYNWLVLLVIIFASAGIKHYWNLLERGVKTKYVLPLSACALILLAIMTSPSITTEPVAPIAFSEVKPIFEKRCNTCHSSTPTDDVWLTAPNGVAFDTPEQIQSQSVNIMQRAVTTTSMPLSNKTGMTEEERKLIGNWIIQGANLGTTNSIEQTEN